MLTRSRRPAFSLFQLLVVLAFLLVLLALLLPAVQKVRQSASRMQSQNNLKQMALAIHNYNDVYGKLPPGVDDENFSASAKLLPFVEQDNVYKMIDFKKSIDHKDNEAMRAVRIKVFMSPLDEVMEVKKEYGPTNYLWNHLVFYHNSAARIPASFPDGTSNTIITGETLKGDNSPQAVTVKRQHVMLKKEDLKGLKDDAGVKPFKDDKNIASDRCASWMDGRFLQGTFNGRLKINDERPDVSCAGLGGVSALRSNLPMVTVAMCDGSVRNVSASISHTTWKAVMTPNGGEVLGADW